MTAFQAILRHQRRIDALLDDVRNAIAIGQRVLAESLFHELANALLACTKAEHMAVYPRLADVVEVVAEVAQARREHDGIEDTLTRLRIGGLDRDHWDAELDRLARQIVIHREREEFSLFPLAALTLDARDLERIERDYLAYHARYRDVVGASITYTPGPTSADPPALQIRFHTPEPPLDCGVRVRFKAA